MKRQIVALCSLLALAAPAAASAREPIEGQWKYGPMVIDIAPCGPHLCGTVVKASPTQQAKAERGSGTHLIGSRLITDIERTGPDSYTGSVFAADRNIHASGTVRLVSDDRLEVKGCLLAVICRSRTYIRVR